MICNEILCNNSIWGSLNEKNNFYLTPLGKGCIKFISTPAITKIQFSWNKAIPTCSSLKAKIKGLKNGKKMLLRKKVKNQSPSVPFSLVSAKQNHLSFHIWSVSHCGNYHWAYTSGLYIACMYIARLFLTAALRSRCIRTIGTH